MIFSRVTITAISAVLFSGLAHAGLIVEDLGAGVTKVTVDPITFTVSQNGDADFLVFEDYWVVTSTGCGAGVSSTMSYSINGGSSVSPTQFNCTGRYTGNFHGFDNNDLAFDFNSGGTDIVAVIGDEIVFGGMFTFSNNLDGITSTSSPWSVSLVGGSGTIATTRIAVGESPVPAPATLALFGLGLAGLGWSKRKKA